MVNTHESQFERQTGTCFWRVCNGGCGICIRVQLGRSTARIGVLEPTNISNRILSVLQIVWTLNMPNLIIPSDPIHQYLSF